MHSSDKKQIRELLDDYLRMYSCRDDRLTTLLSENFSGFTCGGHLLVKDSKEWVAITRQDFAQIKESIRIELKDLAIQSLTGRVAVATSFFTLRLPFEDQILSRETARLVLIFHKESSGWKIAHSSISIPYHLACEREIFPFKELSERNQALEELIAERTMQLSAANENLRRKNEELAREIAQHKHAEEALRQSEALYRLLTENASDVVWKVDSSYRFLYISPADERLRGYRPDEVIGHHVFEMLDEEGIAALTEMAGRRLEAEQRGVKTGPLSFEARHRCKDGRWLWAEVRSTPERDAQGNIIGYYGISREITARKLAEDETRRAKAAAEEANKAKSQFLAVMSHEIRTPINALVGFSTLARRTTEPAKMNHYLTILEQSSRSLMELTNNLLDMSKIEAGRIDFEAVPFNLQRLVGSLEEQYRSLANQKRLTFRIVTSDEVPPWVLGDPIRLRQILANLLSNAVKFTESGTISWRVSLSDRDAGVVSPLVRFEVRDTGIGIPEHKLSQLFQPFQQLDPSVTRKFGGSGLGLAIVHSLAQMMKGQITVESQEGKGSCFAVELPLPAAEPVAEDLSLLGDAASGSVLVVEDNRYNRDLLVDLLSARGFQVTLAEDGRQALRALGEQRFCLILLDIRMPDIDGIEVARRIRGREEEGAEPPVQIIAITADVDAAIREACLAVGIREVLPKPLIPEQLNRVIASHCTAPLSASRGDALRLNEQTCKDMGDNPDRARHYREMLQRDIEGELAELQAAFERDDRPGLARAAHTLKGLCGHLDNREPGELSAWLQHSALSADPDRIRGVIAQLRGVFPVTEAPGG